MQPNEYVVGIDVGGTFTDLVAIDRSGHVLRGKALTTPDDYTQGVFDAIESVTAGHGLERDEFLSRVRLLFNGTTSATNAVAQMKGARVGLITTFGFRDTLRIARSARWNTYDNHEQRALPELVDRSSTVEVTERVDAAGNEIVRLNLDEVDSAAKYLVEEQEVDAIAVCLLWSFKNPAHELAIRERINAKYPRIRVSLSHESLPTMREYERTVTTVLDAFLGGAVADYVERLKERLAQVGFTAPVYLMHSMGGCMSLEEAAASPTQLVMSGPAGGVCGASFYGEAIGTTNLITCDVGGTSFDTALIHQGKARTASRVYLKAAGHEGPGFLTGLSMIEIASIGAGGGSIAWIDARNALRVGPMSAGADPGPVCYGRGGTQPTLTDACLVLGILDPDYYLGGSMKVDRDAASAVIDRDLARPLDMSIQHAAAGVYEVAVAALANNIREVSIEKGHDPRDFASLCFGGAGGMLVPLAAAEAQVSEVIVPPYAAEFSAFGMLMSDFRRDFAWGVQWRPGQDTAHVSAVFENLRRAALANLDAAGFSEEDVTLEYSADMRYVGQAFELRIPVPSNSVEPSTLALLPDAFNSSYEEEYGAGSGWIGAPCEVLSVRVAATAPLPRFDLPHASRADGDRQEPIKGSRTVFLPLERLSRELPVYDAELIVPGTAAGGPALIESSDATVFVPTAAEFWVDDLRGLHLTLNGHAVDGSN